MDRRGFLGNMCGLSVLLVGQSFLDPQSFSAAAAVRVQSLSFRITDAMKEMITHNEINDARCYFWVFKEENFPADCPGPIIFARTGEEIKVSVTNDLDENHNFFIEGVVDSGPIAPGETVNFSFNAPLPGTYLYHDSLNAPVNRVMGLHGAMVVMPVVAVPGNKFTPYSAPTTEVQKLFNDLGTDIVFPGLAWDEGDPATHTAAFRQYVWLLHAASPLLFAEVGRFPSGQNYPAAQFIEAYTNDPYANTYQTGRFNRKPHFFTINGQSGFFSHHNPFITPYRRVGEPVVVRALNAGLYSHSLHLHANHYFVTAMDRIVSKNIEWVDTHHIEELQTMDMLIPFRRPPDVPNTRGIGLADPPLISVRGNPVWPPVEEMGLFFPAEDAKFPHQQSPLCYPMHDHVEPTQTAQGGNYPFGMTSGVTFTGDRNAPGFLNFPNYPHEVDGIDLIATTISAPPIPDHEEENRN